MSLNDEEFKERLRNEGRLLGLAKIGFASAGPPDRHPAFAEWLEDGYGGTMTYLGRQADRRADLAKVLPGVRSVISVAQNYFVEWLPEHVRHDPSRGVLASYAWGADYHDVLLERLRELAVLIERERAGAKCLTYVDTGPVSERDHGVRTGLGFIGKNTMLIMPRAGSMFFLGEILTTAEISPDVRRDMPGCGSCTRCLTTCPTHAFPAEHILNSNLCISYLTIEFRGVIPRELRAKMSNHVFGCDDCQECCPWNKRNAKKTREPAYQSVLERRAPKLAELTAMSDSEYRERFRGTAVLRASHRMMLRNVAISLGNWGTDEAGEILMPLLGHGEPLVRAHAVWAARKIGNEPLNSALRRLTDSETEPVVRAELA